MTSLPTMPLPHNRSSASSEEEASLIAAVRGGDATALGRVYGLYGDMVYGTAFRCLGSTADAEDVLQDVFVGLPEALSAYAERGQFASWLKRVAIRTALMKARAQSRRREDWIDQVGELPSSPSAGSAIVDRLTAQSAINALPSTLRTVFMLREVEGLSHAEIGELLGLTAGASAARLFRAWQTLRDNRARDT